MSGKNAFIYQLELVLDKREVFEGWKSVIESNRYMYLISLCCLPLCKHLHLSVGQISKTTMLILWSNSILMQASSKT